MKTTSLRLPVALSLAGYLLFLLWFPLSPRYNHSPVGDIRTFAPAMGHGLAYAALLLFLYGLYWLAWRRVRQGLPVRLGFILLVALLFGLPLLFTFPINASDVYRYFVFGRITVVHGQSPYSRPPESFLDEPYRPLAGEWASEVSPYGPLWEMAAAGVAALWPNNLWASLLAFKALALLAHLAGAVVLWRLPGDGAQTERAGRALLWAWNPALLLTFAMDGHNDALMLLWLLLGYGLWRRGRPVAGLWLMALGALTKPIGLLPLPFFFLAAWRKQPAWSERWRMLALTAGPVAALAWLAFLPFGQPLALVERLAREAVADGGFSPSALLVLAGRRLGDGLFEWLPAAAGALLALALVWLLWLTWRQRLPERSAAGALMAYLLLAFKFRIWYASWPFPWLLVDDAAGRSAAYRRAVGIWLLLTAQLSVVIYGHVRVHLLGGDQLLAHLVGVPFTFALPLWLARVLDSGDPR